VTSAQIQAIIDIKSAQLFAANETLLKLVAQDMEEYRFHSGEGTQWVIKRQIDKLEQTINALETGIQYWTAKLTGTRLVNFTLRRM